MTGHVGVLAHRQPILERYLRKALNEAETSELRSNCTVNSISEDADWVYVTYDDSGTQKKIRAKFLAAADGKTGFTRKKYLEPKGVKLEWAEQYVYPAPKKESNSPGNQNQISGDLGRAQLEAKSPYKRNTPFISAMEIRIHPSTSLRHFLSRRFSLPVQS